MSTNIVVKNNCINLTVFVGFIHFALKKYRVRLFVVHFIYILLSGN